MIDSSLSLLNDDEWDAIIANLLAFRATNTFCGAWPGWVFKSGVHGLGYYIDGHPAEYQLLQLSAAQHHEEGRAAQMMASAALRRAIPSLASPSSAAHSADPRQR